MFAPQPVPAGSTEERIIRARYGFVPVNFGELWRYRELFLFLAWRDILVRYKQTALGIAWAVLQPLLTTVIFTVVFGKIAKLGSSPILVFAALLPWQFFSNAMTEGSNSLVASASMISKVYFPRLIIPASAVLSGIVDFLISCVILLVLMRWYGVAFTPRMAMLPLFFLMAALASFAVSVWLGALNVQYRDVKYLVPFFSRMGLYVCPVGFSSDLILKHFGPNLHFLYTLNPMVGVIDGFRWCVLGEAYAPYWPGFAASAALTLTVLAFGLIYFRTTEKRFADVI